MKQTAGSGKVSGFRWHGKRIVFYSLPYRLPYTRAALARLEARKVASGGQSDVYYS